MGAKDKRDKERLDAINKRKQEVIQAAKRVFAEKSIEKASMQDIAVKAEVGVASVYRYYLTKMELVMAVALDYWENDFSYDFILLNGTGIEQTAQIIDHLSKKFSENPDMLVFMEQFDSYVLTSLQNLKLLEEYEKIKGNNIPLLTTIIEKGKVDGTIREDIVAEEVGNTCIDLFMTIAQKLILRHQFFKTDLPYQPAISLDVYKEMIIKYLETA